MNWLITGGCGFIGRAFVDRLLRDGDDRVRILDDLSVGTREDLRAVGKFVNLSDDPRSWAWSERLALVEGTILDPALVQNASERADVVVHLAANTGVGPSVHDPVQDCHTNVLGTLNVLEAARWNRVSRFVFASSGAPLGVQTPPLHEALAPRPASPYGASKLAGEGYCSAYYHSFGIETVVLRFGNVYGEGSTRKGSVVAKFIKQALGGQSLVVYGDGSQTRDFIHVSDIVDALMRSATTPDVGGETFQIATAAETSVTELTEMLFTALGNEGIELPPTSSAPKPPGDVQRNFSDTGKARERLGWSASVSLQEGLEHTVRFFVDQQASSPGEGRA